MVGFGTIKGFIIQGEKFCRNDKISNISNSNVNCLFKSVIPVQSDGNSNN